MNIPHRNSQPLSLIISITSSPEAMATLLPRLHHHSNASTELRSIQNTNTASLPALQESMVAVAVHIWRKTRPKRFELWVQFLSTHQNRSETRTIDTDASIQYGSLIGMYFRVETKRASCLQRLK